MQTPHFRERGLELGAFHPATLNLSLSPLCYEILQPRATFRKVNWHPTEPAEDFSFFDCRIGIGGENLESESLFSPFEGLIYFPHPETKPEHFQREDVIEVVARSFIPDLSYGDVLLLEADPNQMRFVPASAEA